MLELGNKQTKGVSYKSYFESIGIDHTSIDWNGLDGALKLDLRQPIDIGSFDMVTNIGTTEHVSEQETVWRNIHNSLKVGGVLVSHGPISPDWWWHGEWYVTEAFYKALDGYKIDVIGIENEAPYRTLNVRMTKIEDKPFKMPPIDTIFHNKVRPR